MKKFISFSYLLRFIICSSAILFLSNTDTLAQSVGVGINTTGAAPDASSLLDVTSTTKGMLIPRMTQSQRTSIVSPATGLMVYQITDAPTGFYYYNGTAWVNLSAGGGVTSVSATLPLASSGGATPTLSITGAIPLANGGTNTTTAAVNGGIVWSTASSYSITPAGTAGQYLKSAGAARPVWAQPGMATVVKDVATTSTTISTVSTLSFTVTAGITYNFHAVVNYSAAATTTGSRWSITGPAGATMSYASEYNLTSTTSTVNSGLTSYDSPSTANATSLTTGNTAVISGTITPTANGTVSVRFASEVSGSAITVKGGSRIHWW